MPPVAIKRCPHAVNAPCDSSQSSRGVRRHSRIIYKSVSSTKRTPIVSKCVRVIGDASLHPNPSDLYARTMIALRTSHAAGDAPLPWHIPCMIRRGSPPIKVVDSPQPVRRKNFIIWMERSMAAMTPVCTPRARNSKAMMEW